MSQLLNVILEGILQGAVYDAFKSWMDDQPFAFREALSAAVLIGPILVVWYATPPLLARFFGSRAKRREQRKAEELGLLVHEGIALSQKLQMANSVGELTSLLESNVLIPSVNKWITKCMQFIASNFGQAEVIAFGEFYQILGANRILLETPTMTSFRHVQKCVMWLQSRRDRLIYKQ
jgi:hypothetical protein